MKIEIQEVLKILKDGAEKPKNKESDYLKAKSDGLMEAYSHAWTLVKNLSMCDKNKRYFLFECINADRQKLKKLIIAPDRKTAIVDIEINYPFIIKWFNVEELNIS